MEDEEQPIIFEKRNEKRLAKMRAYNKKYYERNKEQISEERQVKVCCDICNHVVAKRYLSGHQNSLRCLTARKVETIEDVKQLLKDKVNIEKIDEKKLLIKRLRRLIPDDSEVPFILNDVC